jgi:hypothetical protein
VERMDTVKEQAAVAAREWTERTLMAEWPCSTGRACEAGYLLGHSAGFSEGARAFAEWAWSNETLEANVEAELARFLSAHAGAGNAEAEGQEEEGHEHV